MTIEMIQEKFSAQVLNSTFRSGSTPKYNKLLPFAKEIGKDRFMVVDTKRKFGSGLTLIGSEEQLLGSVGALPIDRVPVNPLKTVSVNANLLADGKSIPIKEFIEGLEVFGVCGNFRMSQAGKPVFEFDANGKHVLIEGKVRTYLKMGDKNIYLSFDKFKDVIVPQNTDVILWHRNAVSNGKGAATTWLVMPR